MVGEATTVGPATDTAVGTEVPRTVDTGTMDVDLAPAAIAAVTVIAVVAGVATAEVGAAATTVAAEGTAVGINNFTHGVKNMERPTAHPVGRFALYVQGPSSESHLKLDDLAGPARIKIAR
jgi:hypothetical protein